jgi:hypothetical protein
LAESLEELEEEIFSPKLEVGRAAEPNPKWRKA